MVSHSLNEEETLPLRRALAAQRRLGHAATRHNGVAEVLGVLYDVSGFSAVVADPALHIIAQHGPGADALLARFVDDIVVHLPQGMRWSLSEGAGEDEFAQVSPLGTQGDLRGIMIAARTGEAGFDDQALLSMVVSQLSVLLELRYSAGQQNRRRREAVVGALVSKPHSEVDAVFQLARAGIECAGARVVRFSHRLDETDCLILDSSLERACSELVYHADSTGTTALVCDPGEGLVRALESGLRRLPPRTGRSERAEWSVEGGVRSAESGVRAGLGTSTGLGSISRCAQQARRALGIAESRGLPVAELSAVDGFRTLLAMGTTDDRAAFCAEILEDIDSHAQSSSLLAALRGYLRANGNMEQAAHSLGIHRHTLRTRLAPVEQVSGRSLDVADQRFELWLAIELRDLQD